jgi:antitoxin ChpS
MRQALRRAGGSLIMTIPKSFIEQNNLSDGAQVELRLTGRTMTIEAPSLPKRYKLADLIAEMPDGLPMAEAWDTLPATGLELS